MIGRRLWLLRMLEVASVLTLPIGTAFAQGTTVIHGGGKGGESGSGGESGGGHSGSGESGSSGESGGGHSGSGESGGGGHGQGRTPAERAVRHRYRHGRTLGGGENTGGETGGGSTTGGGTVTSPTSPTDGASTGPIGGSNGGEHFVHPGTGGWGADTKVLRRP
ncbi:MAG: hypothetical protein KGK10_04750 [Rhodospirillales bacterium]|nr:hypothetical protein [Rhodospirillales bacterium]